MNVVQNMAGDESQLTPLVCRLYPARA